MVGGCVVWLGFVVWDSNPYIPLFKGTISIGNTSEPIIDFQGTAVSFPGRKKPFITITFTREWQESEPPGSKSPTNH